MDFEFTHNADDLRTLAAELVQQARSAGADAAEVNIGESVGLEVSVRCGALENLEMNREQGVSLTVYVGGGEGEVSVSDLKPPALWEAVARAVTIARASARDKFAGLADAEQMATEFPDLDLYHPWALSSEEAVATAKRCEEASWAADATVRPDKSEGAGVGSAAHLSVYANSHGFSAAEKTTAHSVFCGAVAEADGAMERDSWSETRRHPAALPAAESIGATAGRFAARRLGGGKIADCRAPVLFQAPVSHSLIRHFVAAASGGALYLKTSWLDGRLGQAVFPAHFHLREQPRLPGEMRSAAYDADGVATQTRAIVDGGVWRGCFLSAYSARRLGMTSTGNAGGAHNLEVDGETVAESALLARLGRGLVVTELMGQGVNPVTGDYSHGAAGFWVENGEIAYPVSEVTIAGSLPEMFASIACVGDDVMRRGLVKSGSLLIPDMTIGGNR